MSWSVYAMGDKAAVRRKVADDLGSYQSGYAQRGDAGDEIAAAEANQVMEAKQTILGQIDRSPQPYLKVEASGSHGSSWSNTKLSVEGVNLDITSAQ